MLPKGERNTAKNSTRSINVASSHFTSSVSVASELAPLVGEPEDEEVHFVQFAQPIYRGPVELLQELVHHKPENNLFSKKSDIVTNF